MIHVDQSIVAPGEGDCMRAVVASLLELPLDAVPHFMRFGDDLWWPVFYGFHWSLGWEILTWNYAGKETLKEEESLNGFFDAAVPSRTFPGKKHAVVINCKGLVVHDPNPNKAWLHENVLESGALEGWYSYRKRAEL